MYIKFIKQAQKIVAEHRAEYKHEFLMFGGGGGGTTTSNSVTQPWAGQEPYLAQQYQTAQNLYNNPGDYPQLYPGSENGSQVAGFNPQETNSLNNLYNIGTNGTSALSSANQGIQNIAGMNPSYTPGNNIYGSLATGNGLGQGALENYANGSMLSANNPYFQNVANSTAASITPAIESQFTQGNSMNNPAAAYATSQGLGSAIGNLAYQNYNTQTGNQLSAADQLGSQQGQAAVGMGTNFNNQAHNITSAAATAPSIYGAQLNGLNTALASGQAQQNQAQNVLSSQVGAYNYNQQLPYNMLNQYISQTAGTPGSASSISSPYFNNTAQNALGGAVGLGALANGAGASTTGTSLAALLGAAGGAASDRRVKKNIKRIGETSKKIPVYEFEYIWGGKHIGVMSDEALEIAPESVYKGVMLGFDMVDYSKVGTYGNI